MYRYPSGLGELSKIGAAGKTKRRFAVGMGLAVQLIALAACGDALQGSGETGPSVILIVIDTLRADHLGDYGYSRSTDAPLQRFFDQSTVFRQAYAPAPWTSPSIASLLTGLSTARHGTNAHGGKLPDAAITLPEILRVAGWHTAAFSFNHNVSRQTGFEQGFVELLD